MEVTFTKDFMEALIQHGQGRKVVVVRAVLTSDQKVSAQRRCTTGLSMSAGPKRMKQVWVCVSPLMCQITAEDRTLSLLLNGNTSHRC